MVDILKLKGKIIEKGFSISTFYKEINMSKCTYYRRLKDGSNFTVGEIENIVDILSLSSIEAKEIFLPFLSHN